MRAALKKQWGHMRPAGRQFDMPALNEHPSVRNKSASQDSLGGWGPTIRKCL